MAIFSPLLFMAFSCCAVTRAMVFLPVLDGGDRGLLAHVSEPRDAVLVVDVDQPWDAGPGFLLGEGSIAEDDDEVAPLHQSGRRAVDDHLAGAASALDDVGLEAIAVVDVQHVHLLVFEKAGGLHEFLIEGDAALVVEVRPGDPRPVNLALEHAPHDLDTSSFRPAGYNSPGLSLRPRRAGSRSSGGKQRPQRFGLLALKAAAALEARPPLAEGLRDGY